MPPTASAQSKVGEVHSHWLLVPTLPYPTLVKQGCHGCAAQQRAQVAFARRCTGATSTHASRTAAS